MKQKHPMDSARDAAMAAISKIADRAVHVYADNDVRVDRVNVLMDISAACNSYLTEPDPSRLLHRHDSEKYW